MLLNHMTAALCYATLSSTPADMSDLHEYSQDAQMPFITTIY